MELLPYQLLVHALPGQCWVNATRGLVWERSVVECTTMFILPGTTRSWPASPVGYMPTPTRMYGESN